MAHVVNQRSTGKPKSTSLFPLRFLRHAWTAFSATQSPQFCIGIRSGNFAGLDVGGVGRPIIRITYWNEMAVSINCFNSASLSRGWTMCDFRIGNQFQTNKRIIRRYYLCLSACSHWSSVHFRIGTRLLVVRDRFATAPSYDTQRRRWPVIFAYSASVLTLFRVCSHSVLGAYPHCILELTMY